MRENKIKAAKRLIATLKTDEDISWFLMDHPREESAIERLDADSDDASELPSTNE